ncbi:MAG: hypothetical protein AAFO29_09530 [Actinomycetota bacterium]
MTTVEETDADLVIEHRSIFLSVVLVLALGFVVSTSLNGITWSLGLLLRLFFLAVVVPLLGYALHHIGQVVEIRFDRRANRVVRQSRHLLPGWPAGKRAELPLDRVLRADVLQPTKRRLYMTILVQEEAQPNPFLPPEGTMKRQIVDRIARKPPPTRYWKLGNRYSFKRSLWADLAERINRWLGVADPEPEVIILSVTLSPETEPNP